MISTISKLKYCIFQNQKAGNHWKWLLSTSKEEIDIEYDYWTQEEKEIDNAKI